ncbi:hypothetical protein [Flavobacterium sp. 7A]|uniref:hypothetical protein n=1 Tax=Flavobacterium sp. 7A TaxID=2940571 RepID=UPI0022269A56|nr:hypothetical protein [Flavobacterium sp. 7A]MCW2118744.1 FtsZ-binding cell division protein ZapB [Flavobacterium sp. 7A]
MKNSKTIIFSFILLSTLFLASCKQRDHSQQNEKIIEESSINDIPNASDTHFAQAIQELEAKKIKEANEHLTKGIEAIKKEGKNDGGLYKVNLDNSIAALEQIKADLNQNKIVSVSTLKEVIANAEINVAHDYLASSDVYTIVNPEVRTNNSMLKRMENNLSILKDKEKGKIKGELKQEREKLISEGEKLENDMKALQEKMKVHTKKLDEHIKKNYPENYIEII